MKKWIRELISLVSAILALILLTTVCWRLHKYSERLLSAPVAPVVSVQPVQSGTHVVVAGDTVYKVARQHHINRYILAATNGIVVNAKLHGGQELHIRDINAEETIYLIDKLTSRSIQDASYRQDVAKVIVDEASNKQIELYIVLGIFGVESNFNPYLTAVYVPVRDNTNLPVSFVSMQQQAVISYDCQNPGPYHPDMGAMQISYRDSVHTLDLLPEDVCRLQHDPVFNIKQAMRLLTMKKEWATAHHRDNWHLYYHNKDKALQAVYAKKLDKVFEQLYLLLREREQHGRPSVHTNKS